jgi:hypothetical protein
MTKIMGKTNYQSSTDWKALAIQRRLENKELNKRLEEIRRGREKWKTKALSYKLKADNLEREIKIIKNKIENILK